MLKRARDPEYIDAKNRAIRAGNRTILQVPQPSTNKLTKEPILFGSRIWNSLPKELEI